MDLADSPRRTADLKIGGPRYQMPTAVPEAGCKLCYMENYYNKFIELIRPYNALWNSMRVTCVAVGPAGERKSITTRFVLREEVLPKGQAVRRLNWLEPTPEFLVSVVDFPKTLATQMLFKAVEKYHIDLETDSDFERVLITWPLAGSTTDEVGRTQFSSFSWHEPHRLGNRWAGNQFGEDRTCMVLTGTGDRIHNITPSDLYRRVSSKLRLHPPRFDGIDALYKKLLPGVRHEFSDQATFEAVFPLPLDLSQTEDGSLDLRAPAVAGQRKMQVIINFRPDGVAPAVPLSSGGPGSTTGEELIQWTWPIPWPKGAESGKASLFYDGDEVSDIDLRRWPAGNLRAAVDCYFDPEHKLLRDALVGGSHNSRKRGASQAFEMAVVRLMNILGIPLVWYGKGVADGRNDAAGLVERKEQRIVILAECTTEKPEAKFSALRDRAQRLAESLGGEAEMIPVVFTQVDPPRSVFEAAADHDIALVGRTELATLFDMLSVTAREQDPLGFLKRLMSSFQLTIYKRQGI